LTRRQRTPLAPPAGRTPTAPRLPEQHHAAPPPSPSDPRPTDRRPTPGTPLVEDVWEALADFARQTGLDERTVTALHDVAMAGRVRRSRYESAEGLSLQQARRDLRELVTAQVLTPVGRTRARYYTAGTRFPQPALDIAATPMTLTDPYTTP
jgi:hypothetical protein